MRTLLLFLIFVSCLFFTLSAQVRPEKAGVRLRYNVFGLFDPTFPSHDLGIEIAPIRGISILYDHGFIYEVNSPSNEFISGSKSSIEGRINLLVDNESSSVFFLGFRYHLRNTIVRGRYVLGYECDRFFSTNCVYYRDFTGDVKTEFSGRQLVVGGRFTLFGPVTIETALGVGRSNHELDQESVLGGELVDRDRFYHTSDFQSEAFVSITGAIVVNLFRNN
ncbi:MAG: hypothetical protein AAF789_13000 [Bacteroidota bacterium]